MIPDVDVDLVQLLLPTAAQPASEVQETQRESRRTRRLLRKIIAPFPNISSFLLTKHYHEGYKKSTGDFRRLQDIFANPLFKHTDVTPDVFNKAKVEQALLDEDRDPNHPVHTSDGWVQRSVTIEVPPLARGAAPMTYEVEGLHYPSLAQVCRAALEEERAMKRFHFYFFRHFWHPTGLDGPEERIYDEVYTSDAMIEEHAKLQRQPREIDPETNQECTRERLVPALMFGLDATHLADFDQAKAWPVYMYFGNESKYDRSRPTAACAEHVAFIPLVGTFHLYMYVPFSDSY